MYSGSSRNSDSGNNSYFSSQESQHSSISSVVSRSPRYFEGAGPEVISPPTSSRLFEESPRYPFSGNSSSMAGPPGISGPGSSLANLRNTPVPSELSSSSTPLARRLPPPLSRSMTNPNIPVEGNFGSNGSSFSNAGAYVIGSLSPSMSHSKLIVETDRNSDDYDTSPSNHVDFAFQLGGLSLDNNSNNSHLTGNKPFPLIKSKTAPRIRSGLSPVESPVVGRFPRKSLKGSLVIGGGSSHSIGTDGCGDSLSPFLNGDRNESNYLASAVAESVLDF
jgi:hypothetical protein